MASVFFPGDTMVVDCPICLDPMQEEDLNHELQCQRHCGYNFCKTCIESLLSSSKDDYQEASDGNNHVKVFLRCPNCRSDLTSTIRDTLLLRKTDAVTRLRGTGGELNESQQLLSKVMNTAEVKAAVENARRGEAAYLGREFQRRRTSSAVFSDSSLQHSVISEDDSIAYEEWGVEADLDYGVHDSFRVPTPRSPITRQVSTVNVDKTLFAAWDDLLEEKQKLYISTNMTRGQPDNVAKAALLLYNVLHDIPDPLSHLSPSSQRPLWFSKRSSVLELIAESQEVHAKEEKKMQESSDSFSPRSLLTEHIQLEREAKSLSDRLQIYPLPVRMPKVVSVDTEHLDIELIDHDWDGTAIDAYRKITIGFGNYIHQKEVENSGVQRILGEGNHVQIELPGQKRVLLLSAGEAGRQGAVRGDVLTHINGKTVSGMTSMEILVRLQASSPSAMVTLNAERSVAEALKRRATAIKEGV